MQFHLPVLRCVMVRRLLDAVCDPFIAMTDGLADDEGLRRLFLQAIHGARADAYGLYTAILNGDVTALQGLDLPAPPLLAALIERAALYHVIVFTTANEEAYAQTDIFRAARIVFSLDEEAQKELLYSIEQSVACLTEFQEAYALDFAARLVRGRQVSSALYAFVCQFFYSVP